MAAKLQAMGGRRGRGRRRGYTPLAEINMTPFIDVMLVLLIVFMVSAPLLTGSIPVDLPRAEGTPTTNDQRPIVVTVDSGGSVYVGESIVELGNLVAVLQAATQRNAQTRIFIKGDSRLAYGRMAEVMGALQSAGFTQLSLVTDPAGG